MMWKYDILIHPGLTRVEAFGVIYLKSNLAYATKKVFKQKD